MRTVSRRVALRRMALGSAGLCLAGLPAARAAPTRTAPTRIAVEELSARIRRVAPGEVFRLGASLLRSGATPEELLAAAFLSGIRDIRPHGPGGKFHAVLMIESAYQLFESSDAEGRARLALWAMWDFKRCQQRDVSEENDWELPRAYPVLRSESEAAARRAFVAGMEAWDIERAEPAALGLITFHDQEPFFELLRPYGARCYGDFGHKIIYCVHAERTLRRTGWLHGHDVVRSLIRGLLFLDGGKRRTESWSSAVDRVAGASPQSGRRRRRGGPARSLALLAELRGQGPEASQECVAAALAEGIDEQTMWDGLRLHAAEVFYRRSAADERRHLPVHPVTELNAFRHMYAHSGSSRMKTLAVLQAAAWIAHLRADMGRRRGSMRDRSLDGLVPSGKARAPTIEQVFAAPDEAAAYAAIKARGARAYLRAARRHLLRAATQDHQIKFVAALHEESRAMHRSLRARFLAPSIRYIPAGRDDESEMSRGSRRALGRAAASRA